MSLAGTRGGGGRLVSFAQRVFGAGDEPEPEPAYPNPLRVRMPLPRDDMLTIASNDRRRAVLRTVLNADGGVIKMGDLADAVASKETGVPEDHLTSGERKPIYVGLYQCHLPKLDEYGLVDIDDRTSEIATTPLTEHAVAYLDVLGVMHREGRADE